MFLYVPGTVVMGGSVVGTAVVGSVPTSIEHCPKNLIVCVSTYKNTLKYFYVIT